MKSQKTADLILFIIAIFWGLSYLASGVVLAEMGIFLQNTWRFMVGFGLIALFSRKKLKNVSKATWKWSIILGVVLSMVYISTSYAIKNTTLTNASFLSCISVIFIPILSPFYKIPVPKRNWIIVLLSLVGVGLLTIDENFTFELSNLKGDLAGIICSISYANHIIMSEKAVQDPEVDAYQLGTFQLLFCGIINLVFTIFTEPFILPSGPKVWGCLLFLAIFCTGLSFLMQPIALQYTTAIHATVIFTLEPVTSVLIAWFIVKEPVKLQSIIGVIILLASIFVMELLPIIESKKYQNQG